ncbi:MAG: PhnD/SsuA/transferrin family substrate-binding protein [Pseudomonadota bacterium]
MIVALPMYRLPGTEAAHDTLWRVLREHLAQQLTALAGISAPLPETLDRRADPMAIARDLDLMLSQTCGYPYTTTLQGAVRLVATPVYDALGCEGALYRSALLVRDEDAAGALADCAGYRVAINEALSQSGHHALRAALAKAQCPPGRLGPVLQTGSHAASAAAVAGGRADLCAIDCVTWALLCDADKGLAARLRRIGWGPAAPGLPLITAASNADDVVLALRAALIALLHDDRAAPARRRLRITGIEALGDDDYAYLTKMAEAATAAGHGSLIEA